MNYLTSTDSNKTWNDAVLLIVRIFAGFALMSHGYPKLEKLMADQSSEFFNFLGLGSEFSLILAVFAEFVCAIFIVLGLFSRWASFFALFTMIIAAFVVHGSDPFDKKETALLYACVFLILLFFGPGRFSVDGMISKRKSRNSW